MNFAHRATPRLLRQIALGAALSLAFVSSGWAMSFFSPVVQSKKGEPLLAEIDLNDISAQELICVQVWRLPIFTKLPKLSFQI